MKLKDIVGVGLKKLSPRRFGINQENHKFPPLKRSDVCERINKFQNLLGINKELECNLLSERTILIKPH